MGEEGEQGSAIESLLSLMERVGGWMAEPDRLHLAEEAREQYLEATGRVNEEDQSFERRMSLFLEYLLTEFRSPPALQRSCLEEYAAQQGNGLTPRERELLLCLSASHRSIFELMETRGEVASLSDLLHGGQWRVDTETSLLGVEPGDVFEARLVGVDGRVVFTQSFCHHPGEARHLAKRVVLACLARGEPPERIMGKLAQMRLKFDRYHRMSLMQIYVA